MNEQDMIDEQHIILVMQEMIQTQTQAKPIEYRVYYNVNGQVVTYTTEQLEGDYLVITAEQYQMARHDAVVVDDELIYTHIKRHVTKLARNINEGTRCSKYDASVLADDSDQDYHYYTIKAYEITRAG